MRPLMGDGAADESFPRALPGTLHWMLSIIVAREVGPFEKKRIDPTVHGVAFGGQPEDKAVGTRTPSIEGRGRGEG